MIPINAEAANLKLNKAKATMEVDSTLKLKFGDVQETEVKWTTSNKKVATINKWGTITANGIGYAVITGEYKRIKHECKVTVLNSESDSDTRYNQSSKGLCSNLYDLTINSESQVYITVKDLFGVANLSYEEENDVITCYWDEEGWYGNMIILGISLNKLGESSVTITATYSDGSKEDIRINVTVVDETEKEHYGYYNNTNISFPLHLLSNDGKTYLGKIVSDKTDIDCIWNKNGIYGNQYSDVSIFNPNSIYGNSSSAQSAFNESATSPPIIVNNHGEFIRYLTTNTFLDNGFNLIKLELFIRYSHQ
jgi:hypothetical protein